MCRDTKFHYSFRLSLVLVAFFLGSFVFSLEITFSENIDPRVRESFQLAFDKAANELRGDTEIWKRFEKFQIYIHTDPIGFIEINTSFSQEQWQSSSSNLGLYESLGSISLDDFLDAAIFVESLQFYAGAAAQSVGGFDLLRRVNEIPSIVSITNPSTMSVLLVDIKPMRSDGFGYMFAGNAYIKVGGEVFPAGQIYEGYMLKVPPAISIDGSTNIYSLVFEFFGLEPK